MSAISDVGAQMDSAEKITPLVSSKRAWRVRFYVLLALFDIACIVAGFLFCPADQSLETRLRIVAIVTPIFMFLAANSDAYRVEALADYVLGIRHAFTSLLIASGIVFLMMIYSRLADNVPYDVIAEGALFGGFLIAVSRYGFHIASRWALGEEPLSNLVIVDGIDAARFKGVTVIDSALIGIRPDLTDPTMLDRFGTLVQGADSVFIACPPERRGQWSVLLQGSDVNGHVFAPEFDEMGNFQIGYYKGQCVLRVSGKRMDVLDQSIKRGMDLIITVPLILFLAPLLLLVAIAVKLDSKGPVLFRQARMGYSNRIFYVLKFRSMYVEASDASGTVSASRDDDRITRVGRIIRSLSIDELPQLFNVLAGDMSLVGPRPHALGSLAGARKFWEIDDQYWCRHALKPGITGLAQIRGYRGATMSPEDLIKRLQSDLEYMNDWSLMRDIRILLATFRVLRHNNAY